MSHYRCGIRSTVQVGRPFQRFVTLQPHEAVSLEQGFHTSHRVHEAPKWIAEQGARLILQPHGGSHIPPVARVGERQEAPAAPHCCLDQRLEGRLTAHDAIHGHHIARLDLARHGHEVAVHQLKSIRDVAATGLLTSRGDVGRRCLHSRHELGTRGQELEAQRADARANIQDCPPLPCSDDSIPQEARRLVRTSPAVARQIAPGDGVTELTLVSREK